MDPITLRQCRAVEIYAAANAAALWAEYAAESSIPELGPHDPQIPIYQNLEDAGVMTVFGAFLGEELAGMITVLISVVPHYGRKIATTESFFVCAKARSSGAGVKLLKAAEDYARAAGAVAFFVSAPAGGRLERVMPHWGYRESNRVFVRGLV